jgi:hypothetical protein
MNGKDSSGHPSCSLKKTENNAPISAQAIPVIKNCFAIIL